MLIRTCICLAALLLLTACGNDDGPKEPPKKITPAEKSPTEAPEAEPAPEAPLERIVGDLIMTKLDGPTATAEELAAVRSRAIGGVILFGWNVQSEAQLKVLVGSLQTARGANQILVSVDQEGGAIRNVPFAPPEQTQPAIGRLGVDGAQDIAEATGRGLAAAGVNIDLGPVVDLASGPNRTMAGRSFGSDAELVGSFADATVRGLQEGGVAASAKHFPGFGASTANTDDAIGFVDRTRAQLVAEELVPYRSAMRANVATIMVSHGVHRGMGSKLPGIVDPKIATDLLRTELGFEGVAMTDSMNAKGFREQWGDTVPKACPAAVAAGIDLLLLTGTLETARLCRARLLDAVAAGTLEEARVRQAACRITALRKAIRAKAIPTTGKLAAAC